MLIKLLDRLHPVAENSPAVILQHHLVPLPDYFSFWDGFDVTSYCYIVISTCPDHGGWGHDHRFVYKRMKIQDERHRLLILVRGLTIETCVILLLSLVS